VTPSLLTLFVVVASVSLGTRDAPASLGAEVEHAETEQGPDENLVLDERAPPDALVDELAEIDDDEDSISLPSTDERGMIDAPKASVDDAHREVRTENDGARVSTTAAHADNDLSRALTVDGVCSILALPAPSGLGALHSPFVGARLGLSWPSAASGPFALATGVDATFLAGGFAAGTRAVRADRALLALQARGTLGPRLGGAWFSLLPFALVQGTMMGGGTLVRVDESASVRPLFAAGVHAGLGLAATLGSLTVAIETGVGFLGLAPSTTGTASVGWRF